MLKKMKDLGEQLTTKAGDAVDGIAATVKGGVESLGNAAGDAATTLNDKAVRAAVAQMRHVLDVAVEDLRQRPLAQSPVRLTATVNVGLAALQMEIEVNKEDLAALPPLPPPQASGPTA